MGAGVIGADGVSAIMCQRLETLHRHPGDVIGGMHLIKDAPDLGRLALGHMMQGQLLLMEAQRAASSVLGQLFGYR